MQLIAILALVSWFTGGFLLGLIEIITLPADPTISTVFQLLPLLLLLGGIWYVLTKFQLVTHAKGDLGLMRKTMTAGWIALFGVDAGVASINNISNQIFHASIPYYFQGVSLAQKLVALTGIFVLGLAAAAISRPGTRIELMGNKSESLGARIQDKPITNVGFVALLLGIVLGLGQYWYPVVFGGFILLLAGAMLYPMGRLTEKDVTDGTFDS